MAPGGITSGGRVLRAVFLAAGLLFTGIGLVGVVLPVLPTTPFLILAAACFARSSVRLEAWLLGHPRLGPPLRAWRERGAIPAYAKGMAVFGTTLGFVLFRLASHPGPLATAAVALVMLAGLAYVLTRPS
jgi:uncharacterized membrane protein YbaN (DUF454 family)